MGVSKGTFVIWQAIIIVFVASACTLVIELIAGRMLAPYMGVNLYTWTSIIGVVLAGISLGNYLGGWLADRYASRALLGIQFFAAALAALSILPLLNLMVAAGADWKANIALKVVAYVTVIFFLPGFVMGTISPVVVKLSLHDLQRTGKTVGLLYAWSTLGSIVGTFLTGFVLISTYGTRMIVFGVAGILAVIGVLISLRRDSERPWGAINTGLLFIVSGSLGFVLVSLSLHVLSFLSFLDPNLRTVVAGAVSVLALIVLVALPILLARRGVAFTTIPAQAIHFGVIIVVSTLLISANYHVSPFYRETNYFTINIIDRQLANGRTGLALVLDHLIHSFSDPTDPTHLEYGYEKVYSEVTRLKAETHPAMRTFFIGGGGFTYQRYVEATYPQSSIHVAEIDPAVTEVAFERFGVRPDTRIVTYNEDARIFFNERRYDRPYDIIFGDAFNDLSIPYHLTTAEFAGQVHDALAPDGLYVVNVIDNYQTGEFLRAYMNTLRVHFPHVYLLGLGEAWRYRQQSTFIVVAAKQPLDLDGLRRVGGPQPATAVLPQAELEEYLQSGRQIVLTDDYVPVDQLLLPLFEERGF